MAGVADKGERASAVALSVQQELRIHPLTNSNRFGLPPSQTLLADVRRRASRDRRRKFPKNSSCACSATAFCFYSSARAAASQTVAVATGRREKHDNETNNRVVELPRASARHGFLHPRISLLSRCTARTLACVLGFPGFLSLQTQNKKIMKNKALLSSVGLLAILYYARFSLLLMF
jgi:uncharacterized membrane-anchored protein